MSILHLTSLAIVSLAAVIFSAASAAAQRISFAQTSVGEKPKDFETALTGNGKPGQWTVVADASAEGGRALAQIDADTTDYRFPLAIYMPTVPADVEVTTRFKSVDGKVDQAGGIIVRLIDHNNYYLARANALENNVHFYRVIAGRRQQLAGANTNVPSGVWHTLTLRAEASRFVVMFNGKALFSHIDTTFAAPGKVAVWTKADSITRFDWIEIKSLSEGSDKPKP